LAPVASVIPFLSTLTPSPSLSCSRTLAYYAVSPTMVSSGSAGRRRRFTSRAHCCAEHVLDGGIPEERRGEEDEAENQPEGIDPKPENWATHNLRSNEPRQYVLREFPILRPRLCSFSFESRFSCVHSRPYGQTFSPFWRGLFSVRIRAWKT
jgi:hypothetical protein